jgi:hypothetical protein
MLRINNTPTKISRNRDESKLKLNDTRNLLFAGPRVGVKFASVKSVKSLLNKNRFEKMRQCSRWCWVRMPFGMCYAPDVCRLVVSNGRPVGDEERKVVRGLFVVRRGRISRCRDGSSLATVA